MARINVEEEAHRRITKLANLLKISDREACGTVSYLWGESQDILKVAGTTEEIMEWCHLYNMSETETHRWIDGLTKARFISKNDDGTFTIHGNKIQIETRLSNMKRATKGAKALQKRWKSRGKKGGGLKQASSRLQAPQGKAGQGKTIQGKAGDGPPAPPPEANAGGGKGGEISDDPDVLIALSQVPAVLKREWRSKYEPSWLRSSLARAVAHGMKKENVWSAAAIKNWESRLSSWFDNERRPQLVTRPPPPKPKEPPKPWGTKTKEEIRALRKQAGA